MRVIREKWLEKTFCKYCLHWTIQMTTLCSQMFLLKTFLASNILSCPWNPTLFIADILDNLDIGRIKIYCFNVCLCVCVWEHVCAGTYRSQIRALNPLQIRSSKYSNPTPMWVLRIKPWSFARAVSALSPWAIPPTPRTLLYTYSHYSI